MSRYITILTVFNSNSRHLSITVPQLTIDIALKKIALLQNKEMSSHYPAIVTANFFISKSIVCFSVLLLKKRNIYQKYTLRNIYRCIPFIFAFHLDLSLRLQNKGKRNHKPGTIFAFIEMSRHIHQTRCVIYSLVPAAACLIVSQFVFTIH